MQQRQHQRRSAPSALISLFSDDNDQTDGVDNHNHQHQRRSQGNSCSITNSSSKLAAFFNLFGGINNKGGKQQRDEESPVDRVFDTGSSAKNVEKLLDSIQALRVSSKIAAKSAESQRKGANALSKWAERTNNNAVSDVLGWTSELLRMHADRQSTFAKDYEHFLKKLNKVAETEQRIKTQQRELDKLIEREMRLIKLCNRGNCTDKLIAQRDQATAEKKAAQHILEETKAESEVVKMIQLREGLMGMADAQRNFAQAANQIFTCQRELAEFVPAVSTKDVRQMRYDGVPLTRERIAELKRTLTTLEIQMPFNAPSSVEQRHQEQSNVILPPPLNDRNERQQEQRVFRHQPIQQQQLTRRSAPSHQQEQQQRRNPQRSQHQHQQLTRQQHFQHLFGTPPPPYTPTAPPLDMLDSANVTPRHNPNRRSANALLMCNNRSGGVDPILAGEHVSHNSNSRIYPLLPPNPFGVDSSARQRHQRVRHV